MLTPDIALKSLATDTDPARTHDDDAADRIAALHTRTVDAKAGYDKMVEKAEPEFRGIAARFHSLHAEHAAALAALLAARGRTVDADGSFMGTVNETVVGIRAFFDKIDADVMDNIRSGEESVLRAFDEALMAAITPEEQRAIRDMRDALTGLLDDTHSIG